MFSLLDPKIYIIWKYTGTNHPQLQSNVLKRAWIPQNDILGHNKTLLFVTHCGNNGQFEALYHGVPMVGIPLVSDQGYNANRMEIKGYGRRVDIAEATPASLSSTVNEVLNNDTYKQAIQKASKIYRSRPLHPKERAVRMIEHVLIFGGIIFTATLSTKAGTST